MKFLEEIAEYCLKERFGHIGDLVIVFPNRRAGLFFKKYLNQHIEEPTWAPSILNIVDFITAHQELEIPDRWSLIFELYQSFQSASGVKEPIDRFYFWGETLLKDFDEVDRFMVNAAHLFKYLEDYKEFESSLDHLTDQQKELILSFWKNFRDKLSIQQKDFVSVWKILLKVYNDFRERITQKGLSYEGLIYRQVADEIENPSFPKPFKHVIFAGFNALSTSEELIITWYVREQGAKVFWDIDDYYFKNKHHEAGFFFRDFIKRNAILAGTFKPSYDTRITAQSGKKIEVIGTALSTGQTQAAADILARKPEGDEEEWALVLPDEKILLPLLNTLPPHVDKVNITMGYPLQRSLIYGFIYNLLELQYLRPEKGRVFYYKTALKLLDHPFMERLGVEQARKTSREIKKYNKIFLTSEELCGEDKFLSKVFVYKDQPGDLINLILDILQTLALKEPDALQQEFIYQYYTSFNRLADLLQTGQLGIEIKSLLKLFKQLMFSKRLPFEGEPLEGVQIMGILETRNLDFNNVIMLSSNEGAFPPGRSTSNSFIPYNIRKAFSMPTMEHQESIYAYLFYRILQHAEHIYFVYDTQGEDGKTGELSRYIRQLAFESELALEEMVISTRVIASEPSAIEIKKDRDVLNKLDLFTLATGKAVLTPSAINAYLDCRLRFYFRSVQKIYEEEEVHEEMDPMSFGLIFHDTMEFAYRDHRNKKGIVVKRDDLEEMEKMLDEFINRAFNKQFSHGSGIQIEYTGQNAIAREIVKKMALKVLEFDIDYAPFEIVGIEEAYKNDLDTGKDTRVSLAVEVNGIEKNVLLGGYIDRIDKRDNVIRVLDYKTGKDEKRFKSIASLFERDDESRNKAAFQTFFYGMLFQKNNKEFDGPLQAGLFNIRELFERDFNYLLIDASDEKNKKKIEDITPYMDEFMLNLRVLMQEIYDPKLTFDQTNDIKKCQYCPYSGICNR